MTHFEVATGLDEAVAAQIVHPAIEKIVAALEDEAKRLAPAVKVWVTAHDERVRPSHVDTDGQAVPENLRFKVPKVNRGNDVGDQRFGYDMAREPRDPSLPIGNRINCRCDSPRIPTLLKDSIHATPVLVSGTRVTGGVETRFPRAAESDQGTSDDRAANFMGGAIETVRRMLETQR